MILRQSEKCGEHICDFSLHGKNVRESFGKKKKKDIYELGVAIVTLCYAKDDFAKNKALLFLFFTISW